jgi:hypothetical protein
VSDPFFVGCHSRATFGYRVDSALVTETRLFEQNGHPELFERV